MLYWLVLFGFITESIASRWGIPYLFLDPEYMGKVDFWSFMIIGGALGGFIMTYNISSYILNGFRFPFLATLSRPFLKFILNNFIVPLFFVVVYLYKFISFQLYNEYQSRFIVLLQLAGFLLGLILVITLTIIYFTSTNKDIFKMFGISVESDTHLHRIARARSFGKPQKSDNDKVWRVDTYLSSPLTVRLVRGADHYDKEILMSVFRQNHLNAAVLELFVFSLFILLGLFREYKFFRIPTGASITLIFSMFIMLLSAFRFWLRAWANGTLILFFLAFNYFSQFEFLNPVNKAYGLDYRKNVPYNTESLNELNSQKNYEEDYAYALSVLEKWRIKATDGDTTRKPKLIFLNTSGGGLRSALWTYRALQYADSTLKGSLMKHTVLITGASGGMIGASYFRELYLLYKEKKISSYMAESHFSNLGKDLLNPIALSITVSDLFLRIQKFRDGEFEYTKDRAYAFEKQLNENVNNIFSRRLRDYLLPESEAVIPMLILAPTIINDGRRLFISPHSVSYLNHFEQKESFFFRPIPEGIDFMRFYKDQQPGNLRFTSALRMNATFPYILPNVSLPSNPTMEVMDAGVRDNFGPRSSLRFMYVFREWISRNTSGVIFIQIRDTPHDPEFAPNPKKTIFQSITTPVGSFYGNFPKIQQYNHDEYFNYAASWFRGMLHTVVFELPSEEGKISLSWHLTTKEKDYIHRAIKLRSNRLALKDLKTVLGAE
jgi:hypothetical protein